MVGVGEMIASAVLKQIAGKLGDLAAAEVALQWGFKDDALKMVEKMGDLEALMHDADNKLRQGGNSGEAVERWLAKLSSAAYDVEDVLQELAAAELIQKIQPKLKLIFSRNNQLYQRMTVPRKIKNLRKKIEEIQRDSQMLKLVPHETRVEGSRNDETFAATGDEGMRTLMVGRGTEVDKIINLLLTSEDNEHISIIPIVGLGGIGKTTLAQSVLADNRVKVFDEKVWVHVSKVFNLMKIGKSIIKIINSNIPLDNCTLQFLSKNLRNELATKRYLIVLDDLWEENPSELVKLKSMLPHNCQGSRVIVTTRNQSVVDSLHTGFIADKICPVPLSEQINLYVLSPTDCWTVMKQRAFKPGDNQSGILENIGMEIAEKKCGGLPLVANALGHVMSQSRTVEAWERIRDTQILEIRDTQIDERITLEFLMVSYNFMKLDFKMCFKYLAAFSKGFVVDSDHLIQQWIALRYIGASDDGQRCIKYLLGMSFLEISRPSSVSPRPTQAKIQELTMHDLVHDLATKIMGNEFLVLDASQPSPPNRAKSHSCRHAQLINYHNQPKVFKYLPPKVRSLHFRNNSAKLPLPRKAFSRSKYIRVLNLDLSGCSAETKSTPNNKVLPSSILKLKLLKYLDATGLPFASLPMSIHTLQNMQSLILSNCSLETLPDNVCSLHKLCYLDLSGNRSLNKLPTSLGKLSKLSFLNLSGCSVLQELPESICELTCLQRLDMSVCRAIQNLPDKFGSLLNLSFLSLSGCSKLTKLPDSFGSLPKLLFLNLSGCSKLTKLPDIVRLEFLDHLDLSSCHELENLPKDFGKLKNLVFLNLSDCYKVSVLPETFCKLTHLKDLDLSDCHELKELPDRFGDLSELESLNLISCSKLQLLPESLCKLSKLRNLNLAYCMRLKELPSALGVLKLHILDISSLNLKDLPVGINTMTTLTHLESNAGNTRLIDKAEAIKKLLDLPVPTIHTVERTQNNRCSNIAELAQLTCRELEVVQLQKVCDPEDAQRAKLRDKSDLRSLGLRWGIKKDISEFFSSCFELEGQLESGQNKDVLERLVPPRNLDQFMLQGYMDKDFPYWMCDISSYLPSLTQLSISHLEVCDTLPPLGKLPNLRALHLENCPKIRKVGREFYGDRGTCMKLRWMILISMENLVEWWTTQSGTENGEFLIPNLHSLRLEDCPNLKFLPYPPRSIGWRLVNSDEVLPEGGFGNLSSSVAPFKMLIKECSSPNNWHRLEHFPSLEEFIVESCSSLRALPEAIGCFTSLKTLHLGSLEKLGALPECLGLLTSLDSIFILDCPNLTSMPESMKDLTSLRLLVLKGCIGLKMLPEGIGQLISLQELYIGVCSNLTSLPKSMKNLSALRIIWLHTCPGLDVLPEGLGQLSSLQELTIELCPNLTSLPESIRNLTALKKLEIVDCPILVRRCQGEDAHKISHILDVIFGDTADAGASTSGDLGAWTYGDAGASTSRGDTGTSTSDDAGPSTSRDPMRGN